MVNLWLGRKTEMRIVSFGFMSHNHESIQPLATYTIGTVYPLSTGSLRLCHGHVLKRL